MSGALTGCRIDAILTLEQVRAVAAFDSVMFIEEFLGVGVDMDVTRCMGGADYIEFIDGFDFRGQGVRAEVMDVGLFVDHLDFNPDPIIHFGNFPTLPEHGTPVYGIVFGDATADTCISGDPCTPGDPCARGLLPNAEQGFFASGLFFTEGSGFSRDQHTEELVDPSGPYRCVFQTNSWGDTEKTEYTAVSAELDDILFKHDILLCQSQGNCGNPAICGLGALCVGDPRCSRPQAWAKNAVSVGGFYHYDDSNRANDSWSDGDPTNTRASIGLASDGRVKPDLANFYDGILTTCHVTDDCYTTACNGEGTCTTNGGQNCETCAFAPFGGTSAATPITCGYFGLLFQMWHEEVFCPFGGGASVFSDRPHMSTAKAMMINTAYRYPIGVGGQTDFTRFNQGWGAPDIANLYDIRDKMFVINETVVLKNLESWSRTVEVGDGEPELRVTLVYTDPMGTPLGTPHRVNDLSLKVISPTGDVYWGNHGLDTSNFSLADANPANRDTINTVENVFVEAPNAGEWVVTVSADEICASSSCDAHVETPAIDADFALVVAGVLKACCVLQRGQQICIDTTREDCAQRNGTFRCAMTCTDGLVCPPQE